VESLRGQLLIAAPGMPDYFRRSVVLVIEHGEQGAMGVVLNRPSEATVADAVPQLAELASPEDVVHAGGPVSPTAVVAIGDFEDPAEAARLVVGDVGLVDPDRTHPALRRLRVYAGYAGWAPGQLDAELEDEAWIVEPAEPDDPFQEEDLWAATLQRKGGPYALLATMPADPSMN
jgi:putative transcriptional regulator